MPVTDSQTEHISEIEAALLDAELFMKYQAPEKAIKRLRTALDLNVDPLGSRRPNAKTRAIRLNSCSER